MSALALLSGSVTPALAQQAPAPTPSAPGVGAWLPGPVAAGDRNTFAGVIDAPSSGASVAAGPLQLSGWFVDQTAQGWAGADDVEIFAGSMESGGRPLGHAQFAQNRSDVATALKNPFWAASGWSAKVSTAALPAGPTTLSVYVHTPARGWWLRQVPITVRPAPGPIAPTPAPAAYGNDISSPQCPTGAEPSAPAFGIVGATGGKPFAANPCLPREFVWALTSTSPSQSHVGFYMNTANPGPTASPNWPSAQTTLPRPCDGSWSADCAYDYGWLSALDAFNRVVSVAGTAAASQAHWWLDVEEANSWSAETATNAADLEGAVAFLRSQNISTIGIYTSPNDWAALIGPDAAANGLLTSLPDWRPGPTDAQDAPNWCTRTITGGRVKFVQFPSGGFDTDLACY